MRFANSNKRLQTFTISLLFLLRPRLVRPVARGGRGGRSGRTTPPPALKGHFFADCSSANIHIVRQWNRINKIEKSCRVLFELWPQNNVINHITSLKINVFHRQPMGSLIFKLWKRSTIWGKRPPVIRRPATGLLVFISNCLKCPSSRCPVAIRW